MSFKSIATAFILMVLLSVWTVYSEHFVGSINSIAPPPGAIFVFFCVVFIINPILKKAKLNFRESELILIYSILLVSAPISAFAISRFFISILLAPHHFATPENEFKDLFHHFIPNWFAPSNFKVVRGFYEQLSGEVPFQAWLKPLLVWIPFILTLYIFLLCLSIIIHKHWIDIERLTFPTVHLPLSLASEPKSNNLFNSFLKNRFMWFGFAIPVFIHGINGLNFYFPVIPSFPLKTNLVRIFVDKPWNAIDTLPVNFYPNVIGFTYLLPIEISLSCWFFYLLSKIEMVLGSMFGWTGSFSSVASSFPSPHYQSAGAFIAIILLNIWMGRRYIASVFLSAFHPQYAESKTKSSAADVDEIIVYRFAFVGLISTLIILFFWLKYAGMGISIFIGFIILFFIYSLSAGRVRTQAGLGAISGPIRMDDLLRTMLGTRRIGAQNLTLLAHLRWATIDMRGFMSAVPALLEVFKMGKQRCKLKYVIPLIISSVTIALTISCLFLLKVSYKYGAAIGATNWWMLEGPQETFSILRRSIVNPQNMDWSTAIYVPLGLFISSILIYMRTRFLWWPFHPIGYAVGFSRLSVDWLWFSVFLAWLFKHTIMRYGGIKLHRRLLPMFLGLVLGDFFMAGLWGIIGTTLGGITYTIFP